METKDNKALNKKGCITCGQEFDQHQSVCPDDGTILTPLNDDKLVGTILADRYEVLEVIGGGGMGLVYKARHRLMNRIVAIKTLHRHLISSAETLKRFQLEAQAASCLSLPNILTIYDFGITNEGQPYMVMDYLEGISLSDIIEKEGHLSVDRFLNIFSQACAGLAHAHQKGVLHRDIKPSNIMLVNYGDQADFVKIVDFGIAKLLNQNDGNGTLTRTGEVYGSPSFMSPEQCRGKELDMRSDIYSMGCVMFRSVTGHNPFSGQDIIELLFKQVSEVPPTFDNLCPELEIPEELEKIILKAMAKDPSQRYQTMGEAKDAIDHLREKLNAKAGGTTTATTGQENVKPLWRRSGGTANGAPPSNGDGSSTTLPATPAASAAPSSPAPSQSSAPPAQPSGNAADTAHRSPTGEHPMPDRTGKRQSNISAELDKIPTPSSRAVSGSHPNPNSTSTPIAMASSNSNNANGGDSNRGESAAVRRSMATNSSSGSPKILIGIIAGAVVLIFAGVFIAARNSGGTGTAPGGTETSAPLNSATTQAPAADFDGLLKKGNQSLDAGDYTATEREAQAAVSQASNDGQKGSSLTLLGRAYIGQRSFSKAEKTLKDALALREKKFGRSSAETAETLSYLGAAQTGSADYEAAESSLKEALANQQKALGNENRPVAQTLIAYGSCLERMGNAPQAQAKYQDALKILKKVSGKWDPALADADLALAKLYESEKRYADAAPLAKQALTIRQEILGSDNSQVKTLKSFSDSLAEKSGGSAQPATTANSQTNQNQTNQAQTNAHSTPTQSPTAEVAHPTQSTQAAQNSANTPPQAVASRPQTATQKASTDHSHHGAGHHHSSGGGHPSSAPAGHRRAYSSYGF